MKMDDLDSRFVEFYQKMGAGYGLDSLFLKLFALLYLEPEPVALEDLAKKTGYSLASISNKAKMLESFSLVTRKSKPGTRKVFLYAEKDFTKILKAQLLKKVKNQIRIAKEEIPDMIKEFKGKSKTEQQKKKLKILENYYRQILKFEEMIQHVLKELDDL